MWNSTIAIKNIGSAASGPTTSLYRIAPIGGAADYPTAPVALVHAPSVPAGGTRRVSFGIEAGLGAPSVLYMVMADAPVPGKRLGQVDEGHIVGHTQPPGELNNCFGSPLDRSLGVPQVFVNPAAG
jgi:hypothetical protein